MQWGGEGEESGSYTIVVSLAMMRRGEGEGEESWARPIVEVSFMEGKLVESYELHQNIMWDFVVRHIFYGVLRHSIFN